MAPLISLSRGRFWRHRLPVPAPTLLNNDGYYWFLRPYLEELAMRTGRLIDPRGDCRFTRTHVTDFGVVIAQALAKARESPPTFEVEDPVEETLTTVDRKTLITLLTGLDSLAATAQRENLAIVSEGEYTLRERGILTDAQKQRRLRAAEAAERYLDGRLSWSEFNDQIDDYGDDADPLIGDLEYEEHQTIGSEWYTMRDTMLDTIERLRRSIDG